MYGKPIHDIPATPETEGERWQVWGQPENIARPWMKERNGVEKRREGGWGKEIEKKRRDQENKKEGGRKKMVVL